MEKEIFWLDGKAYHLNVIELKRKFAVTDSELSERVLSHAMERDIIGTFYNYSVKITPYTDDVEEYDTFYDAVSDPHKDSHAMTFPYGQEALTFQAYVTQGEDSLKVRNGKNLWAGEGLSLEFVAIEPQRRR